MSRRHANKYFHQARIAAMYSLICAAAFVLFGLLLILSMQYQQGAWVAFSSLAGIVTGFSVIHHLSEVRRLVALHDREIELSRKSIRL